MENEIKIAKKSVDHGQSFAGNEVCLEKLCYGAEKMRRNCRKKFQVLEKLGAHGCCHISFPKSCCAGKHA